MKNFNRRNTHGHHGSKRQQVSTPILPCAITFPCLHIYVQVTLTLCSMPISIPILHITRWWTLTLCPLPMSSPFYTCPGHCDAVTNAYEFPHFAHAWPVDRDSVSKGVSGQKCFSLKMSGTLLWGSGSCPPGNVFNLEINLVQSGAKKRLFDKIRFVDVPSCLYRWTNVSFPETGLHFSLKSAKSLRNDTPVCPNACEEFSFFFFFAHAHVTLPTWPCARCPWSACPSCACRWQTPWGWGPSHTPHWTAWPPRPGLLQTCPPAACSWLQLHV